MVPLNRRNAPPPPGPEYRIIRLKANESIHVTLLCQAIWGVFTHWDNKARQSLPCFEPTSSCRGHKLKLPLRWKGFLHCLTNKGREIFLEITPTAAEDLRSQLGSVEELRGKHLVIKRMAGDKARLQVNVWAVAGLDPDKLPPEKDPYKVLLSLWGYHDLLESELTQPCLPTVGN